MLLDIARFWASRATLGDDGRYHILKVIGPDGKELKDVVLVPSTAVTAVSFSPRALIIVWCWSRERPRSRG